MGQQGAWTKWENALQHKIIWSNIWKAHLLCIRFLVQVVYDVLLEQLLSGFPKALAD